MVCSEEPSQDRSLHKVGSLGTSENVAILAKESLEMGKMLGLRVVDNEEGALKRLIASLKKGAKRESTK